MSLIHVNFSLGMDAEPFPSNPSSLDAESVLV